MGLTQKLGTLPIAVYTDTSNNVGIGGAPSGSYKFEVTGTAKVSGAATFGGSITAGTTGTLLLLGTSNTSDKYIALLNSSGNFFCSPLPLCAPIAEM